MKFNKSITGFDNENEIAEDLNDKFITELNPLYRMFIEDLYPNCQSNEKISCWVDETRKKYDIVISIGGLNRYISIKKGAKNSVHMEGISSFIHFLIENHVKREAIIEYLKYHYGDGTTNGTGVKRISATEYKQKYQEQIDMINEEFNQKELLLKAIDRFVLSGNYSDITIDGILFGVRDDFIWIKKEDIIKIILAKRSTYSTGVHFGPLTVQPLDRCLNYNPKYEIQRFCVQIKWYNLADDIIQIMNEHVMNNR